MNCQWCGTDRHGDRKCPLVKAIEYYDNPLPSVSLTTIKRIEFFSPAELLAAKPLKAIGLNVGQKLRFPRKRL